MDKRTEMKTGAEDDRSVLPRVFVHTPEPASSPALYVSAMTRALTEAGVPVHVICPADHQAMPEFEANPRVTVHPTAERNIYGATGLVGKVKSNARFLFSSAGVLFWAVRRGDIVNFQYILHLPFCALFFLFAWMRGCRIVFTAHDPLPHKWLFPAKLRWLERGALGWIYRISDVVLVHSEGGRKAILDNFKVAREKVQVIVHGPYELGAGELALPESEYFEVLMFGALRENKCQHLAIEAVQRLWRKGVKVRLTIAGRVLNRKEQAYWDGCLRMIEQAPEPIQLMQKFIPDEDLPALFRASHCLVLPYENFHSDSGVAFMALANGRPILSTRAGGLGELLALSEGGIAIESASVEAVEAAMLKAQESGAEQLKEMGRRGQDWVLRECGWGKVATQMREVFKQFAPQGRPDAEGSRKARAENAA